MDSIISTFHIDWKTIIAQMVNFGVVFVILYIYALKPLSKLMAERQEKIEQGIDDAKSNALLLENTRVESEKIVLQAKAEAEKIFQEGKKEATAKRTLMLEDAKVEVAGIIENGKQILQAEKAKIVEEAKEEIVSLAMLATEKLVSDKADESFNQKTVKELNNL